MSSGLVRIYNFDRYFDRYLFMHPTGPLREVNGEDWDVDPLDWEKGIPDVGNVKKFWFGRSVLVYTFAGVPYVKVGREIEQIRRADAVTQICLGPFCLYRVKCGRVWTFALGTKWLDFISRYIDPTYDEMDSLAADFAGYVKRVFERTTQHRTNAQH